MTARASLSLAIAAAATLVLSACSFPIQMMGDYPSYTERSLIAESTLIVEGVAVASESTVLTPRFEGDTPEENPLLGLSEEEKRDALREAEGVAATAVTVTIDVVHRGGVVAGDDITIIHTGGTVGGISFKVDAEPPLAVGERYLLFASDGIEGTFVILGGSAGMFVASGDEFAPVNPDLAPFARLTSADVARLVE